MSQVEYPPPSTAYPAPTPAEGSYTAPPPPAGYPTRDGEAQPENTSSEETKSRGEGFWKGCCAALCCCCVLDTCF